MFERATGDMIRLMNVKLMDPPSVPARPPSSMPTQALSEEQPEGVSNEMKEVHMASPTKEASKSPNQAKISRSRSRSKSGSVEVEVVNQNML